MSFRAPWLVSRRRKLLAIALDFLIIIFIYQITYNNKFSSYPNFIVSFSVTNFWIIVSYILGRYMKIRHINLASFTNALFKTSILFLACNIIYLLINWGYSVGLFLLNEKIFFTYSFKELSNFFIKSSFYFSIVSFFAQYFLSLITHTIYDSRKDWIFWK